METVVEQNDAEQRAGSTRLLVFFIRIVIASLVLLVEHDSTPRSDVSVTTTGGCHSWGTRTYLIRGYPSRGLCLSCTNGCWTRSWNWRRTHRSPVDKLNTMCKLQVRLRHTASLAILTGALNESVDLGNGKVITNEVADVVRDHGTPVRAALCMVVCAAGIGAETLPAEVMAAALACELLLPIGRRSAEGRLWLTVHVVASTLLLDIDAALGTRLCAQLLDRLLGLLILAALCAVARSRVPGAVAGQAELVVTVWAGCLVGFGLLLLGFGLVLTSTVFGGEVDAAIWVEAGDVRCICGEEVLGDRSIPPIYCQHLHLNAERWYLRLKESLGQDLLQRRVVEDCLTFRKHARQMGLCELARRHLCLDLLLDAEITHTFEVSAGAFHI